MGKIFMNMTKRNFAAAAAMMMLMAGAMQPSSASIEPNNSISRTSDGGGFMSSITRNVVDMAKFAGRVATNMKNQVSQDVNYTANLVKDTVKPVYYSVYSQMFPKSYARYQMEEAKKQLHAMATFTNDVVNFLTFLGKNSQNDHSVGQNSVGEVVAHTDTIQKTI